MKDVIKTLAIVSFMAFIACGVMAFLHGGTLCQVLWQACLMVAVTLLALLAVMAMKREKGRNE
jgi:hypothetical protein